jgi:hypothetical protein
MKNLLKNTTMKTNKFYNIVSILVLAFTLNSCVEDGDFTVPDLTITEPNVTVNSSVAAIKTSLQQEFNSNGDLVYTFPVNENNPTYLEGYVVSSDATGNFYKTLVIQDKVENPTAGVEIVLNKSSLSEKYNVGRKVYVLLDGLSVSYDDGQSSSRIDPTDAIAGKYTLGMLDGDRVDDIPSTKVDKHILRSGMVANIVPTSITIGGITEAHINTFVTLPSAQFQKSQIGKTFAGEADDEFDGFRDLFECNTEATLKLQTSTFASFKANTVPIGKGSIKMVLTKDYRAEFLVGIVNTPSDISFDNSDRCDPPVLDCGTGTVGGSTVLFDENFTTITSASQLATAGWTSVNVNGGSGLFTPRSFGGNQYLQASAFRSGEDPFEAWVVTPAIDLDSTTAEELTFETNTGYDNGAALSVFVSTDFSGDVKTATWLQVDATLSSGPSSGYGSSFTQSGSINLSCLSGNVYVAFRYLGADGGVTTTFQVDNVKVTGK